MKTSLDTALLSYLVCLAVSALCAGLLLRSRRRTGSRLVTRIAFGFVVITLANIFLVADYVLPVDLSLLRAVTVAAGLGILVYGVALEEQQ
jgi:lipopolysaccharide export LptBFGC system permease protein LptF